MSIIGYFRMQHGWLDHPVFGSERFDKRSAWAWLIDNALYKPTKVNVRGKIVELNRGQLTVSVRYLADAWKWPKSTVSRWISTLIRAEMIASETGTGQIVITICNYEKYQEPTRSDGTEVGRDRDSSGTVAGQIRKKDKEGNEEGKKEGSDPNGSDAAEAATGWRDLKAYVFRECLAWLVAHTPKNDAQLRPLLGKWCKESGEAWVIMAIDAAMKEQPIEPISWINAKLGSKPKFSSIRGGYIPMAKGPGS